MSRILVRGPLGLVLAEPIDISYEAAVRAARKFLRNRDFLHYGSQLIPERLESETWSLAWAYVREVDDVIDSIDGRSARAVLAREWERVRVAVGRGAYEGSRLIRDYWLTYFFRNLGEHYSEGEWKKVYSAIRELYLSALIDAARRGRILTPGEMVKLLKYKAVAFFKLYFTLGRFKLNGYEDKLAELLGLALGLLDDFLDALYDLKVGYVNLTSDEIAALRERGAGMQPPASKTRLQWPRAAKRRGLAILKLLMKARHIAHRVRNPLARKTILRLTEAFAAPILEGRFVPGAIYFFKGGKLLLKLLPRDEMLAYEVGHRMIGTLLSIPQLTPALVKLWVKLTS